ncbi:MAG: asparagine synthase (glutamine-hydrolyzing) [Betaproteobacteria bacterium]|nr:asparagine synthase (glutamine-hydrolyzing) [Betaproteobacteria bacterium]
MCGIAGYVGNSSFAPGTLADMTARLAHRGPDAFGSFEAGPVHLGHRRLSVIDLAGSSQPMTSADGTLTVVYNGEIYNFRALRDELARGGWAFRTSGDTEVLLAGWRAWGARMVDRLRGMFAFVLWDARESTLFAARDHLGVKPFHYAWDGSTFVFGSEIKALLAHPAVSRELDLVALRLYLECQFIPAPHSIFGAIRKLPPGHELRLRGSELVIRPYWRPDYADKPRLADADAVDALDHELRASVQGMLVADVPVGAFVSGGVDSGLIAAIMTDVRGSPIDTFNIGFEGDHAESEHREAAAVARHIGSQHHAVMLRADDVLDAFDHWIDIFDEPFADQAALPTMLLAAHARRRVTVVLTGEGADEVLGGYANYRKREREERHVRWLAHRASPLPSLLRMLPARARRDRMLRSIVEPIERRYRTIPNVFDALTQPSVLTPELLAATAGAPDVGDFAARAYAECNSAQYLDRLLHVDTRLWLPDDLLTKVDRATMAHSLEARVPYLDHRFVEFCARLDAGLKIRGATQKFLLKRLARRYLPAQIVSRGKQGFVMPLSQWLGGRLAGELAPHLLGEGLERRGIFRPAALRRLLAEHRAGRRNHAGRLWALLILERWFRRHAPEWRMPA